MTALQHGNWNNYKLAHTSVLLESLERREDGIWMRSSLGDEKCVIFTDLSSAEKANFSNASGSSKLKKNV